MHELPSAFGDAVRRVRSDFLEMPDLRVTVEQGARLWQLQTAMCRDILRQLAHERFLVCRRDRYGRH